MKRAAAIVFVLICIAAHAACGNDAAAPEAQPTLAATVLRSGDASSNVIALVFELRPGETDPGSVAEILAALRAARVRATFALTGRWVEANVALTRAIAADGHLIINGGYDGASFTGASTHARPLTFGERALQLSRTETTVYRITNRSTRPFFRPPFDDLDASVEQDVASLGYGTIVLWSVDARSGSARSINERVLATAEPGAIASLSAAADASAAEALPVLIAALRGDGYGLVTVDVMVR